MLLKNKVAVAGALVALLGLSACANPGEAATPGSDIETTTEVALVQEIADMLPAEIAKRGTLQIGATSTNMPAQFTDEAGELVGVAIELYDAAATVLGLKAEFDVVTFDALQPGVDSGRYDLATMGDNIDRQKLFDIISIYKNGFAVLANNTFEKDDVDYLTGLCGHSVAGTKGTLVDRTMTAASEECVANGEEAIDFHTYVDNAGVALAVKSEQDEVGVLEIIVALAYADRDSDNLRVAGLVQNTTSGPAIKKGNDELRDAFHAALQHLVEIGFYEELMSKYGIKDMMIPEMPINNAK
ncbi:transporter substrate-binding domain-containing protein [Cryobacterium sp. BB307]|uniref:transporter substrate-binding domain-containing protein n=1 Tax=Cryobacterium sp. BB307 TaxID=2716317 RepID=UPI001446DC28|nr:transporter substrate-binding domain-containing protein [Cryobacterium sp. BB307]